MRKPLSRTTPSSIGVFALMLSLVIGILLVSTRVLAQTGTGVIRGVVRDANQAVVPGANITITNQETGVSQKSQTSEVGIYYIGGLQRGRYLVEAELAGFKKWTSKLELQVGQTAVVDVALELGNVETVVDVIGAAAPITTETSEVSDVKDFQRIQQLPLNGRQVSTLFDLTPGVEGGSGGSPRVNGQKVGSLEMSLDGLSIVDRFGGGISRVQPGLDTVAEFRIETVGSDARYSRPATVTLSTRSGTNGFHGSLFEVHRNNAGGLRARRREETTGDSAKLIRNEFGVTAGGPVLIPKLYDGRNKSFWFFAYEGYRARQANIVTSEVPTDANWNGDLSNLVDDSGNKTIIYDPLTTDANGVRQPFPGNRVPANRINNVAKVLQQLTAKPTNSNNPVLASNFTKAYGQPEDRGNLTFKGDQVLSDKDRLSVRWTRSTRNASTEGGVYGNPVNAAAGLGTSRSDATINNVSTTYSRNISPHVLNELVVGVHRSYKSSGTLADFTDYPKLLGLPNPFGVTGWPSLYASGSGNWGYWDSDNRKDEALTGVVGEDNATWVKGKHTFQFGGKVRREYNNVRELQQAQGSHTWDGTWTSLYDSVGEQAEPFTGNGFADMLLGLPSFLSNQFNRGFFYFRQTEIGLYFNDSWKVTPRLTLNFGLRWDKWTPYTEQFNRLAAVDIDTIPSKFQVITPGSNDIRSLRDIPPSVLDSWSARGLTYTTADQAGYPSKLFAADNNNFGPRLGAAFKINDRMVLRGGYGEYFWPMPLSQILQTSRTQPPLNLRYTTEANNFDNSGTYSLRSVPGPDFFHPNATVKVAGIVPLPATARDGFIWDGRNWKDGRSQTWHLTLEREVLKNTAVRFSYIGNHGSDLEQRAAINNLEAQFNYVSRTGLAPATGLAGDIQRRVNPNWSFGNGLLNRTGFSNSHSAQVELERRYSSGYGFQLFYVFNRTLTTTDAGGFTSGNAGINDRANGLRVPQQTDIFGAPSWSYDQLRQLAYSNSTNIPAHHIRYNGILDLPFGKGKKFGGGSTGVVNQIIGGWQVATIGEWRGGFWNGLPSSLWIFSDPILQPDQRVEFTRNGVRQRLWIRGDFDPRTATNVTGGDLAALVPVDRSQRAVHPLGPTFTNQLPQRLANGTIRNTSITDMYNPTPRGFIIGPGSWNADISLFKWFDITETVKLRVTADFFNAFNHPVDVNPNLTNGTQDLYRQANEPRIVQFSLRLNW